MSWDVAKFLIDSNQADPPKYPLLLFGNYQWISASLTLELQNWQENLFTFWENRVKLVLSRKFKETIILHIFP